MRVPQVSERIKEAPAQALRGVFAGIGQLLLITDKLRNKTPAGQDVPRARTPEASAKATVTSPAGQRGQTATAPAEPAAAEPVTPAPAAAEAVAADAAVAAEPAQPPTAKPATAKPATAEPAAKPATARRTPAKPPKRQSPRDFDKTGNVRLLGDQEGGSALSATAPTSPAAPASTPEAVKAPEPVKAPESVTAAKPASSAEPVSSAESGSGPADSEAPLPNYDELSVASLRARLRNLDVARVRQLADYERAHAARADVLTMFERRIAKLEAEA